MKVLLINGSPRKNGCVFTALSLAAEELEKLGIATEIFQLGSSPVRDCNGCGYCEDKGVCVHDDIVNTLIAKAKEADGFIVGSPVYYSHPTGQILSVLDCAFYAGKSSFEYKPAAAIVTARRAGTTASLDVLSKYFADACMPQISSTYWNMVHGNTPDEIMQDKEGLQTVRNLARNTAWILKCIEAGAKAGIVRPVPEQGEWSNFVR